MKLVFGEEEVAYPPPQRKVAQARRGGTPKTTVTVAKILEGKYELLDTFFNVYYDNIIEILLEGYEEELEFVFNGKVPAGKFASTEKQVEALFREFIEGRTAERVGIPGTPTKAAIKARRPSFFDTGLFKDNVRFWVEL